MRGCVVVCLLVALVLEPVVALPQAPVPLAQGDGGTQQSEAMRLATALVVDAVRTMCKDLNNQPSMCSQTDRLQDLLGTFNPQIIDDHVILLAVARLWRASRSARMAHILSCVQLARQGTRLTPSAVGAVVQCLVEEPSPESAVSFLETGSVVGDDKKVAAVSAMLLVGSIIIAFIFTLVVQSAHATWEFPAFGISNSPQTGVNVSSRWIEIIAVFLLVALEVLGKGYGIYRDRRNEGLFHAPLNSILSTDECYELLGPMAKMNSITTFLSREWSQYFFVAHERDESKPMSYAEWDDPKKDSSKPDPLRALVKCYYVDKRARKALADKGKPFGEDDPEDMLKMAYAWRKVLWEMHRMENELDIESDKDVRAAIKVERAKKRLEAEKMERKLSKEFESAWENLFRHADFLSSSSSMQTMLDNTQSWGNFIVPLSMVAGDLYGFLDLSPECPPLIKSDGSIKQHLIGISAIFERAQLPTIYNARTWMCSHAASINVEEGAACSLRCQAGFTAAFGNTLCDSLGGGGMAWTHLNAGLSSGNDLDMPSCCISEGTASTLTTDFSATLRTPTLVSFRWNTNVGFAHACGANQTLDMQVCVFTDAEVAGGRLDRVCNEFCTNADQNAGKCFAREKLDLVPSALWVGFNARDSKAVGDVQNMDFGLRRRAGLVELSGGAEIGDVDVTVPAGANTRARLVAHNAHGAIAGPWVEIAQL